MNQKNLLSPPTSAAEIILPGLQIGRNVSDALQKLFSEFLPFFYLLIQQDHKSTTRCNDMLFIPSYYMCDREKESIITNSSIYLTLFTYK